MAYDPRTQELLMYGGAGNTPLRDTWAWDGTGWSERSPHTIPPGGYPSSYMAYDPKTHQMVMIEQTCCLSGLPASIQTWVWTGHDWVQRHPIHVPGYSEITYDASLGKLLTMGYQEILAWDGSDWATIHTPHVVDGFLCCLTYDPATRQVLYLTEVAKPTFYDVTWIFDGHDWTRSPSATPYSERAQVLVYDDAMSSLLYIGAVGGGQTWSWNGSAWRQISASAPTMGIGTAAAYDAARRQVVVFGGMAPDRSLMNTTWIWDGQTWTPHT